MKKIFSILIFLSLLFTVSCSTGTKKSAESSNTDDSTSKEETIITELSKIEIDRDDLKRQAVTALNALPDTDISADGQFTIASTATMEYVPNGDSSAYGNAMLERNKLFEKKYNAELVQFTELTDDVMIDNAEKNLLAGLKYTDLFSIPASKLHRYAENGLLLNINSLPKADFSAGYFDTDRMNSVTIGYKNYAVYGDFNKDLNNYYCIYINHSLFETADTALPYLSVENGEWTWDKMYELSHTVTAKIPNVGTVSAQSFSELTNTAFMSCGYSYFTSGYGNDISPSFASDSSQRLLETLRKLCPVYSDQQKPEPTSVLFCLGRVSDMETVKTMGGDWGMLPLPKQDSGDSNYLSYLTFDHAVICVYAGANTEKLFAAIEGLYAASSGEYMTEAFYDDLILNSLPNSNTLNMLDYILGRKSITTVDMTDIYASGYPELLTYTREAIAEAAKGNTVHIFSAEDSAKSNLSEILKNIK